MFNQKTYEKPLPEISTLTKPFWDYCKKHELRMQYCTRCSSWIWYPKAWCPDCGRRDALIWRQLSGNGEIYSFTVIRQVIDNSPAFQADLPFAVGLVELEEGPRMYSNVTGTEPEDLKIGDKVSLYFDDATQEITLPKFRKILN
ncbi:MAG: Zn-ribbon domain-containing OB-fold protein [Nitrososphaerales archaeon]